MSEGHARCKLILANVCIVYLFDYAFLRWNVRWWSAQRGITSGEPKIGRCREVLLCVVFIVSVYHMNHYALLFSSRQDRLKIDRIYHVPKLQCQQKDQGRETHIYQFVRSFNHNEWPRKIVKLTCECQQFHSLRKIMTWCFLCFLSHLFFLLTLKLCLIW